MPAELSTRLTLSEFVLDDPVGFRELMRGRIDPTNDSLPDTVFRFGVEFSDGRKATSLDRNWGSRLADQAAALDPPRDDWGWRWSCV